MGRNFCPICLRGLSPGLFMCRLHWYQVPAHLRRIILTQPPGFTAERVEALEHVRALNPVAAPAPADDQP